MAQGGGGGRGPVFRGTDCRPPKELTVAQANPVVHRYSANLERWKSHPEEALFGYNSSMMLQLMQADRTTQLGRTSATPKKYVQ